MGLQSFFIFAMYRFLTCFIYFVDWEETNFDTVVLHISSLYSYIPLCFFMFNISHLLIGLSRLGLAVVFQHHRPPPINNGLMGLWLGGW